MSDDDGDDLYIDESASAPPARSTPTMSLTSTSMGMWADMGVKMTGKGRIAKKPGPKSLDATARKRPRGSTREMANLGAPAELHAGKRSRRPATTTPRIIIEEDSEIAEAAQVAAGIAQEQEAAEDQAAAAAWARESIGTRDGDAAVLAAKKRQSMRASRRAASAVTNEARVETINRLSAISRELAEPDWGSTKSAIAELYEKEYHFILVGVACHAELASKEHGWRRIKNKVKPYVDGTIGTLRRLVRDARKTSLQKARLEDARQCREVMKAYQPLAANGELCTFDRLDLWTKKHEKHRGVLNTETSALCFNMGMGISRSSDEALKRIENENQK